MPWFFSIPEFLKKRACRYLLQHYMGQFLAEKISLEDLTVDLYSGTGTITNVDINVEAINEVLVGTSAPVRVVSGYIGHVTVSVPWTALLKDSCKVEISGLALSIVPHIAPSTTTDEPVSMTDSLFFSMTTSLQLAEEVLKSGPSPGEASAESSPGFEGMEALARAIELVLARVQITLKDTVVQVNYETADHSLAYFLKLRVKSIQFYDEMSQQESSVDGETEDPPQPVSMVTKVLQLSGLSVELDYSHLTNINFREEQDFFRVTDTLTPLSPPAFGADMGGKNPVLRQSSSDSVESESDSQGVPIAQASGEISVRVKLQQSDTVEGPKLEVEGHLAALHILLSPQQLQMLVEMATGIASHGSSPGFSHIPPGQNRPIPKGDMHTIESQLRHHVREERQRKQRREDLLHADPWEGSLRQGPRGGMLESSYSSTAEEFFSLELGKSMTEVGGGRRDGGTNVDDLFVPFHADSTSKTSSSGHVHGRHFTGNNLDSIPLHEGQGLQQLSQSPGQVFRKAGGGGRGLSPPTQRSRSGTASSASGSSYSSTQSTTSRQIHMELQHDLCRYMFTVSGVTIALLETDPPHIHTTPGLPKKPADSLSGGAGGVGYGRYSSLDEGGLDPARYFENMAELLKNGVNRRVLQEVQEKLAQILPTDHLFLWLSTVRAGVSNEGSLMDLDLSVASAELWEYLYRNEANLPHITSPISVSPIIQLVEDSAQSRPCVKLKLSMCLEASKKRSSSDQQTSIDLSLTTAHVNLDVTLLDRAQPLLRTPLRSRQSSMRSSSMEKNLMKHSLYMTTSNYYTVNLQRQAVFNQAVAVESAGKRDHRTSIRVDCSSLDVSLRFPIPDLQKDKRPPWYHSSLRPEVLYVVLTDGGLSTLFHSGGAQHQTTFDAHFNTTKAYLSCDGSSESRELFMTVGSLNDQQGDGFSTARIKVEVQPIPDSVLEQPGKGHRGGGVSGKGSGSGYSSLEEMAWLRKDSKPSPFSGRMDMVSTGKVVEDGSSEENVVVHSEELIIPGSPEEMAEFEQHASSVAQYSVNCSLPSVNVHLPSKAFLETLYNRFGSDLVLWKPAAPAVAERTNARSMLLSCMDVIQPAITKEERFQMCKSVLKEEESDEEGCDEAGLLSTVVETQQPGPSGLSLLALTVAIDRGRMSMLTAVEPATGLDSGSVPQRQEGEHTDSPPTSSLYESATFEPEERLLDLSPRTSHSEERGGGRVGEHGLAVVEFSDARLFITSGYLGDATHDYLSGQIKELSVSHLGSLEAGGYPLYSSVDDAADHTLPTKLPLVVNKSEEGARLRPGSHDQPMFAIAMEIKLDAERNTKTNKCAVALYNTTVHYHMSAAEHSCFKQLGDFFGLTEEPVPGYEPPSFITELHAHTFGCALEYRPLHLPLRALLTVDSVSLSTNVVTGAPLLVLRLMVDETLLFLSNKQEESTNLQQDYVCVMELDWFQMTLRLCNNAEGDSDYQKVFSRLPEISMECSSNTVHLRTCVDSCLALRDLLVYMATYGDLQEHAPSYPTQTRAYSSLAAESSSSLSSQNSYSSSPPLASLKNEDIGDLISEAMEDTSSLESSTLFSHRQPKSTERHKRRRSPRKDLKSNLQIHMSTEKSVHMVFNSDSEDEGHLGSNSSAPGFGGRQSYGPQSPRGQPSSPKQDSLFSESDDDFCILDAPTTTKVAPGAKPVVKSLLEEGEELKVIENHFAIPDRRTDQLQRPKSFPEPVMQYTLKEITVVWHLYGGGDFSLPPQSSAASSPGSSPLNVKRLPRDGGYGHSPPLRIRTTSGGGSGSNGRAYSTGKSPVAGKKHQRGSKSSAGGAYISGDAAKLAKGMKGRGSGGDWKAAGGPGRDHTVLMEIELDKVRLQHETYPPDTEQISRVVLLVHNAEIRDRLADSQINKFLYQYTTEARPRQSHANMVSLKVLFTRPELEANPSIEEAAVRLSLLPIRLNIDQDAVFFLYEFIKKVTDAATLNIPPTSEPIRVSSAPGASEVAAESVRGSSQSVRGSSQSISGGSISDVFIKSFVFQPELPIRIDYEGKRFQMEAVGTLAGILLGLSHLDCSEVTLKSLTYKKGLLGWDKLVEFATNEWIDEIKSSQLPLILKGVGPMHHVTQLFLGMKDLVWLPWEQYQEDGRIVRGLQRGASSFTTSTGVAFVELTSRLLHTVQSMAQMAYDIVTPGNQQSSSQALVHQHKAPHQPLDFREGVANAYDVVTAGIGGTARDLMHTAAIEHEEKGMTGAVGGVLRQLPGTLVKPIILASEATRHVLGGMRNQFVPDARKEANEKWRTNESAD